MAAKDENVWKYAATAMGAILVSLITFWLTDARHHITKEDLQDLAPYAKDRAMISTRLEDIDRRLATLQEIVLKEFEKR